MSIHGVATLDRAGLGGLSQLKARFSLQVQIMLLGQILLGVCAALNITALVLLFRVVTGRA